MRIGFVTGEYPPMQGGVGDFVHLLALQMVDQGHQVFILTDHRGTGYSNDPLQVSAIVDQWDMDALLIVADWSRQHQLDVINFQYQAGSYHMSVPIHLLPTLFVNSKLTTTFHDLLGIAFPSDSVREALLQLVASYSAQLICIRRDDEIRLRRRTEQPITRLPIGSNIPIAATVDQAALRQTFNLAANTPVLGYFGFLDPRKGIETLIAALTRLRAQSFDAHLIMIGGINNTVAGSTDAYIESVRELIAQTGLTNRVHWTGFLSATAVSGWLQTSDLIVLPFRDGVSESNGTLMAALAHGCCVVTTRPPTAIDEFQDGTNLTMFTPGDSDDLTTCLTRLLTDPGLRDQFRANARVSATQFTWAQIAERTLAVFRR